jgi:hypothetical protein
MTIPTKKKKPSTRANRNSPEAAVEENSKPYDEIGKTDEEIVREDQQEKQEPGASRPSAVPTDGS